MREQAGEKAAAVLERGVEGVVQLHRRGDVDGTADYDSYYRRPDTAKPWNATSQSGRPSRRGA